MLTWSRTLRWAHQAPCWVYSAAPWADHWPLHPAVSGKKTVTKSLNSIHWPTLTRTLYLWRMPQLGWGCWEGRQSQRRGNLAHWWPPTHPAWHLWRATFWIQMDGSPPSSAMMTACRVMKHGVSKETASSWSLKRKDFCALLHSYSNKSVLSASLNIVTSQENKAYCHIYS